MEGVSAKRLKLAKRNVAPGTWYVEDIVDSTTFRYVHQF